MVVNVRDYNMQWRLQIAIYLSYPIAGCGQGVIEVAERRYSIKLSDGNQLLTVSVLKVQCALYVFLKQTL